MKLLAYSYLFVYSVGISGFNVSQFNYTATVNDYDNLVVAAFRPRGHYFTSSLVLSITSCSGFTLSDIDTVETNPLGEFNLSVTLDEQTGITQTFICSMDQTSTHYITKVLGTGVFDKNEILCPVYVFESYPVYLKDLNDRGLVRGISMTSTCDSVEDDFLISWQTAASPTVVSEVRGGIVSDLFRIIAISDGDASNVQIKVSILNIDIDQAQFDILVRDYNDTDDNMVVLERYSRCSMDPDVPGYIALKIGTSDTTYTLNSKYIMVEMADGYPVDSVPAGFKGYTASQLIGDAVLGNTLYKTQYYEAGDIVTYDSLGNPIEQSGDRLKRVTLGLSSQIGYDDSLFGFKGKTASTDYSGISLVNKSIRNNRSNYYRI